MGNLHLITGYRGEPHIAAEDHGAFNAAVFGSGEYVLRNGNRLSASVISNNQVRVLDGCIMMQGRHIRLDEGSYVDLTIENGTQGTYRNDLIVARYTKDTTSGVEDCNLVVIKGTAVASDPSDPAYTSGDIIKDHVLQNDMLLYRVPLIGLNVQDLVPMFSVTDVSFQDFGSKQDKTDSLAAATTISDGDYFPFYDVSASGNKKTLWSNIVTKIRTALFGTANGVLKADGNGMISAVSVDSAPTSGSTNLVTSGGVKNYVTDNAASLDSSGKVAANQASSSIVNIGTETALTLNAEHCGKCIVVKTGATVTLPTDSSNTIFPIGTEIEFFMNTSSASGTFTIVIEDTGTVGFATSNGRVTSITSDGAYAVIALKKITTASWIAKGDIA